MLASIVSNFFLLCHVVQCGRCRGVNASARSNAPALVSYNVSCSANKNLTLDKITRAIFFICSGEERQRCMVKTDAGAGHGAANMGGV